MRDTCIVLSHHEIDPVCYDAGFPSFLAIEVLRMFVQPGCSNRPLNPRTDFAERIRLIA